MNFKIRSKKMNKGGGITIPSDIRKLYGFSPDEPVKIEVQADGSLLLTQHRRVCMICSNSDHVEVLDGVAICLECATKLAEKFNIIADKDHVDKKDNETAVETAIEDNKAVSIEVKEISNAIDKDITEVTKTEQLSVLNTIVNSIEIPSNAEIAQLNIEVDIETKPTKVEEVDVAEVKKAKTNSKARKTNTTKKKESRVVKEADKEDELVVSKEEVEVVNQAPAKKTRARKTKNDVTSNNEHLADEVSVTAPFAKSKNKNVEFEEDIEDAASYILEEHKKIRNRKKVSKK